MQSQTPVAEIDSENYRFLQEHVYSETGIVLEEDKHYLFDSRLTPIVRQLGLGFDQRLVRAAPGDRRARRSAARWSRP